MGGVGGVLAWVAWVARLRWWHGWCASVDGACMGVMLVPVSWVVCLRGWHAVIIAIVVIEILS